MSANKVLILLVAFFGISSCAVLPKNETDVVRKNIHEFTFATWNLGSGAGRWDQVKSLMATGLDVLVLQETGDTLDIAEQLTTPEDTLPIRRLERSGAYTDSRVTEHIWSDGSDETFYLYCYVRNAENQQQNMAIVSRQRARDVIVSNQDRPVVGVFISNSIFFNVHAGDSEPDDEATLVLDNVQRYTGRYFYPGPTYMLMGDFNRTPDEIRPFVPAATSGKFIDVVSSGQSTSGRGELDYGVAGGADYFKDAILGMPVRVIDNNFSTHKPARFN